jgi:branched-chain amino acid transport system substrate-binding protein
MALPQVSAPMATLGRPQRHQEGLHAGRGLCPGIDSENAFKKEFEARGGVVVIRCDAAAQSRFRALRAEDQGHEARGGLHVRAAGEQSIAFMKAFDERGLAKEGIRVIGPGDITDDDVLNAIGEPVVGVITSHHYSADHDSRENKAFVKAFGEVQKELKRPNFMAVGGYDGMAAIAEVVKKLGNKIDGDAAMEILKNTKLMSPRGPIAIDPATRDIVQTVYIRRVEKRGGEYWNVEFDKVKDVKDPGK